MTISFIDGRENFARQFMQLAKDSGIATDTVKHSFSLSPAETIFSDADVALPPAYSDTQTTQRYPTIVVPGLLGDTVKKLVTPFMCARKRLTLSGYQTAIAWTNGRQGSELNARTLRDKLLLFADQYDSELHVIGYSKGCADVLTMLGMYPETHSIVKSVVSLAGVVHGTPLADRAPRWLETTLQYIPVPGVAVGDGNAISDLSKRVREPWLNSHPVPEHIYCATVAAVPESHRVSRVLRPSWQQLNDFSEHNDSQVIAADVVIPNSVVLAVLNADHWAIALPFHDRVPWLTRWLIDKNQFPRTLMMRAIIDHLDRHAQ